MTELERLALTLLTRWRAEGGADDAPMVVSAVLDRVLPYRVARRVLGVDVSEDYEALLLRLLAEEENLVRVEPVEAADMARATINSRLPDLDALQLLRAATVTFDSRALARLGDAPLTGSPSDEATLAAAPVVKEADVASWATEPASEPVKEVPSRTGARDPRSDPSGGAMAPPSSTEGCWSCGDLLPVDRVVKFCPFCGADQRQPICAACGASSERGWKHCAECGAKL